MMMSPEWYYEEHLKGKTAPQIESVIRSLNQKIKQLQRVVANPGEYPQEWGICPDPEVQLRMYRLYLKQARAAFIDAKKERIE